MPKKMHLKINHEGRVYGIHYGRGDEKVAMNIVITDMAYPDHPIPAAVLSFAGEYMREMVMELGGVDPGPMCVGKVNDTDDHVERDGPTLPEMAAEILARMEEE